MIPGTCLNAPQSPVSALQSAHSVALSPDRFEGQALFSWLEASHGITTPPPALGGSQTSGVEVVLISDRDQAFSKFSNTGKV